MVRWQPFELQAMESAKIINDVAQVLGVEPYDLIPARALRPHRSGEELERRKLHMPYRHDGRAGLPHETWISVECESPHQSHMRSSSGARVNMCVNVSGGFLPLMV